MIHRGFEFDIRIGPERAEQVGGHARSVWHRACDNAAMSGDGDLFARLNCGQQS